MNAAIRRLTALGLMIPACLAAAPHDPDPSFGVSGTLALPFFVSGPPGETDHQLEALAETANQRIAMVGRKIVGPIGNRQTRPLIAVVGEFGEAINQGFIFDSEWNPGFTPGSESGWLNALQTLPNGDLLYCGGHTGPGGLGNGQRAVVGRLKADLTPDTSFGEAGAQGWQRIALGLGDIDCHAIEQLSGGRILVGGSYVDQNLGQSEFNKGSFLAMLTADGQLDPSFAGNGIVIRFRGQGSLPTEQFGIVSLRQGHGFTLQPEQRPVIAIERNLADAFDARAFSVKTDGEIPFADTVFTVHGAVMTRGLKADRLPTGALQSAQSRSFSELNVRRYDSSMLGHGGSPAWLHTHDVLPMTLMVGGMALDIDGQTLTVIHTIEPGVPSGPRHRLRLRRLNNAGGLSFDSDVGSGLNIPPGTEEVLDVADAVIQTNGRYLVLFNRLLSSGAGSGPQRAYLRRFTGGSGSGASWFLDLLPAVMSFPAALGAPGNWVASEPQTVAGLSQAVSVPAQVSGGEISVNNGPWTSAPVELSNGHEVRLRGRAPLLTGDTQTVRLRTGGLRAANSWNIRADSILVSDFLVQASEPVLPGARCSAGPLNTNCSGVIPDGSGNLESTINLVGSCPFIADVRVGVDISHPRVGDLRLILKDPNGQVFIGGSVGFVTLMDQPNGAGSGPCTAADVLARFEDQAATSVQDGCAALPGGPGIAGTLRPAQSLGTLAGRFGTGNDGAAGNGLWTLIVRDLVSGQSGTLNDWSVDVSCANSVPNLSDLAVTATGGAHAVAGDSFQMSFLVTNQGPATASFGRFHSIMPNQHPNNLRVPVWICSASSGSSCDLPPGCIVGLGCPGPLIDLGLTLLPGGSATISLAGTINPSATPGATLAFDGRAYIPLNIAGNADPNGANNQYLLARTIEGRSDLEAVSLTAATISANRIRVQASWRNNGPSPAGEFSSTLDLPSGYAVAGWSCSRGGASCGLGEISANQRSLTISGQSASTSEPFHLSLEASFSAPQPAGQVSLQLLHPPIPFISDPQAGNNTRSADIPIGPQQDQIFSDRFQ